MKSGFFKISLIMSDFSNPVDLDIDIDIEGWQSDLSSATSSSLPSTVLFPILPEVTIIEENPVDKVAACLAWSENHLNYCDRHLFSKYEQI